METEGDERFSDGHSGHVPIGREWASPELGEKGVCTSTTGRGATRTTWTGRATRCLLVEAAPRAVAPVSPVLVTGEDSPSPRLAAFAVGSARCNWSKCIQGREMGVVQRPEEQWSQVQSGRCKAPPFRIIGRGRMRM